MDTSTPTETPQRPRFTDAVMAAMRKRFPEELADSAWDNTGLLLDSIDDAARSGDASQTVFLTIDLTQAVADEAIAKGASVIVTYHPIIFRGLKSLTLANTQQTTLLKLARRGIAVYSPHTAIDASPFGLNAYLTNLVSGPHSSTTTTAVLKPLPPHPSPDLNPSGYGMQGTFSSPVRLSEILQRLAKLVPKGTGETSHLMVASPIGKEVSSRGLAARPVEQAMISSFAVCAGSGADVLAGADVDLLVTGEMSHHAALKATEEGRVVVSTFHSNSERAFLKDELKPFLEAELGGATVVVSEVDRDPFEILPVLGGSC